MHVFLFLTSDPSLTPYSVSQVMEVVSQWMWRYVGIELSVPQTILDEIDAECSSHDGKTSALANYVVTTIPGITWEIIATTLYRLDEERAVQHTKLYLHIIPGESGCYRLP